MRATFGPSGNPQLFYEQGYKASTQMPAWLKDMGLDIYEYNCSKGVKVSEATGLKLREEAENSNIKLTVHGQYYISLSSADAEKRNRSVEYIIEALNCCRLIGATKLVVHPGGLNKMERAHALALACDTLKRAVDKSYALGLNDIFICPETMGKINQLGTTDEIIELCKIDKCLIPTIDFGHINSREMGILKTSSDYEKVLDDFINALGYSRMKNFHSHFSKIEYSQGGEKRHLTFEDTVFGPFFEPLAEVLVKKELAPTIICESAGTQATDALFMKNVYNNSLKIM